MNIVIVLGMTPHSYATSKTKKQRWGRMQILNFDQAKPAGQFNSFFVFVSHLTSESDCYID